MLKDKIFYIRLSAIRTIHALKDKSSIPDLQKILGGSDDAVELALLKTLADLGDNKLINHLLKYKDSPDIGFRRVVADALKDIGDASHAEILKEYIKINDTVLRRNAARSLALLAPTENIKLFYELLDDPDPFMSTFSMLAFVRTKDTSHVVVIARFLNSRFLTVAKSAAFYMGKMTGNPWKYDEKSIEYAKAWWKEHKQDPSYNK